MSREIGAPTLPGRIRPSKVLVGAIALSTVIAAGQLVLAAPASAAPCSPSATLDNGYTVFSFTSMGTCTWTVPGSVSTIDAVLIVGGGGGGGYDIGGGGGAGGLVDLTNVSVTPGASINVTVGAGGAGGASYTPTSANSGSDSVFNGVTAIGGGYGGAGSIDGAAGGSGGGAGYSAGLARTGGAAQQSSSSGGGFGFAGGSVAQSTDAGAGGGGAGGAGAAATRPGGNPQGGAGGAGVSRSITGTATFYAGGGGGGSQISVALGGSGVGGNGGLHPSGAPAMAGVANTGSGGGGGRNSLDTGGAGAAGIVIVRVAGVFVSAAQEDGPLPPSWAQAVARPSQNHACEPGWSPSWDYWPNNGQGGWVCNREIYWDRNLGGWSQR